MREVLRKDFLTNDVTGPQFTEDEYSNLILNTKNYFHKPNLIFYYDDDQDLLDYNAPIGENKYVDTQEVTKIWEEGISFTNCYTPMALCAPSRSCLYTGLYPLKNGCFANHIQGTFRNKS